LICSAWFKDGFKDFVPVSHQDESTGKKLLKLFFFEFRVGNINVYETARLKGFVYRFNHALIML